jgi:HEAT repeat protein
VLRDATDEEQRAMAAYVIGYATDKRKVVDDLQYALHDPDDTVRNNASRSLAAFAVLAHQQRIAAAKQEEKDRDMEAIVKVSPTWFVAMLNSLVWSDRNNAAVTLVTLTDDRDPETLDLIKSRALPSLVEMASWKHLPHALPAYILLGRVLGLPEQELQDTWSKGERMSVVKRAQAKPGK